MGVTTVIPSGGTQLCEDEIGTGEEDRVGSQAIDTDECRTKGYSQDSGA
jgi:hypothetical protein